MFRRVLVPLAALAAAVAAAATIGGAGAVGAGATPTASAHAWAIRVVVPNASGGGTSEVAAPPVGTPAYTTGFSYPSDGSVITTGATTASVTTILGNTNAVARAAADVSSISIFGGEITVSAVAARSQAGAQPTGAAGDFNGTSVTDLVALGQSASSGRLALADWGTLTIASEGVDTSAPTGAKGYTGNVTAVDIHLNTDHGGLPAGSEILIGYADAAAQTPPPPAAPATTTSSKPEPTPTTATVPETSLNPTAGDTPSTRPRHAARAKRGPKFEVPPRVHPPLTAGRYVFPVYGPSSYIDSYGFPRADVSYHHGVDIFGQLGQPLVAVADGTVFSVGWNDLGGNRLWIRDGSGNEFYYAHLSAFSTLAVNGAHVRAGQVVGFMGNTGDAEGTPYHLHFEVHPVSLLYRGYDGAVDPFPYLQAWQRLRDLPFPVAAPWVGAIPGSIPAPEPGAMLLAVSDISSADGLDPASLRRALAPPRTDANGLPPSGIPTTVPPKGDLGRS